MNKRKRGHNRTLGFWLALESIVVTLAAVAPFALLHLVNRFYWLRASTVLALGMLVIMGSVVGVTATLFSLAGGMLSLLAADKLLCPATVLYIPALLPMIPGMYAYRTVFSLIKFLQSSGNESEAIHYLLEIFKNGITTASVLFTLAVGATIPLFIFYKRAFTMTRASRRTKK